MAKILGLEFDVSEAIKTALGTAAGTFLGSIAQDISEGGKKEVEKQTTIIEKIIQPVKETITGVSEAAGTKAAADIGKWLIPILIGLGIVILLVFSRR